jgi:hypothetical protein
MSVSGHDAMTSYVQRRFDCAPRGATKVRRRLLDGNPVRAVVSARKAGWGAMASWRGEGDRLGRGMLVPKNCPLDLDQALTGRTSSIDVAKVVLSVGGSLWTNPDRVEGGARIEAAVEDGRRFVRIEVPGDKRLMAAFNTDDMKAVVGIWLGTGTVRYAMVPTSDEDKLLSVLAAQGHAFNFDGRFRKTANSAISGMREREEDEDEPESGPSPM